MIPLALLRLFLRCHPERSEGSVLAVIPLALLPASSYVVIPNRRICGRFEGPAVAVLSLLYFPVVIGFTTQIEDSE